MGRDLTLYPQKATKDELKKFIEKLEFERCDHLWDWPEGTLNYSWFEEKDFLSIDGVIADIYPPEKNEIEETSCKWALHVRNRYSASLHDVKMLNQVLREGRKKFGGNIYGDYGKNRYAPLWSDNGTPVSRGVAMVYRQSTQTLGHIKWAIEQAMPDSLIKLQKESEDDTFVKFIKQQDPIRYLYNGLIPLCPYGKRA